MQLFITKYHHLALFLLFFCQSLIFPNPSKRQWELPHLTVTNTLLPNQTERTVWILNKGGVNYRDHCYSLRLQRQPGKSVTHFLQGYYQLRQHKEVFCIFCIFSVSSDLLKEGINGGAGKAVFLEEQRVKSGFWRDSNTSNMGLKMCGKVLTTWNRVCLYVLFFFKQRLNDRGDKLNKYNYHVICHLYFYQRDVLR